MAALVRESAVASLRSKFYSSGSVLLDTSASAEEIFVAKEHFDIAFTKVSPSVLPHVSTSSFFLSFQPVIYQTHIGQETI